MNESCIYEKGQLTWHHRKDLGFGVPALPNSSGIILTQSLHFPELQFPPFLERPVIPLSQSSEEDLKRTLREIHI
jgi:hypothetical protein